MKRVSLWQPGYVDAEEAICLGGERVYCIDAKFNFDDAARFRQERLFAMDDGADEDPRELAAANHGLNFIPLNGNIACLGLAFLSLLARTWQGVEVGVLVQ